MAGAFPAVGFSRHHKPTANANIALAMATEPSGSGQRVGALCNPRLPSSGPRDAVSPMPIAYKSLTYDDKALSKLRRLIGELDDHRSVKDGTSL